jgi:hypothetical protein
MNLPTEFDLGDLNRIDLFRNHHSQPERAKEPKQMTCAASACQNCEVAHTARVSYFTAILISSIYNLLATLLIGGFDEVEQAIFMYRRRNLDGADAFGGYCLGSERSGNQGI